MTIKLLLIMIIVSLPTFGGAAANRFGTAAENNSGATTAPQATPTPAKTVKSAAVKPPKAQIKELLPKKISDEAAVSPVYKISSKNCKNLDGEGSEGEDFLRRCKGYGDYSLVAYGFDYHVNYRVELNAPNDDFSVVLFPLETGEAAKYVRADLYDIKLADQIEWRLNNGKPYAIIVRAEFYKNTGSRKTFANPKNKVAEFVFVRGLKGCEDLKVDLPVVTTAYNPDEQARSGAAEYLEKCRE